MFAHATRAILPTENHIADSNGAESPSAKRPASWSPRNWPVRWKVVAIVVVPSVLAMVFGGFRIASALTDAHDLRLAADRAEVVPAIANYMSALDVALLASPTGGDVEGVKKNYDARKHELQARLAETDVAADVGAG
ncbi:MAG TPA: ATP-binding protein, partial [Mycobacterium sp.]|nr:ATP-binding protein [Mycobacterium sp.]